MNVTLSTPERSATVSLEQMIGETRKRWFVKKEIKFCVWKRISPLKKLVAAAPLVPVTRTVVTGITLVKATLRMLMSQKLVGIMKNSPTGPTSRRKRLLVVVLTMKSLAGRNGGLVI